MIRKETCRHRVAALSSSTISGNGSNGWICTTCVINWTNKSLIVNSESIPAEPRGTKNLHVRKVHTPF